MSAVAPIPYRVVLVAIAQIAALLQPDAIIAISATRPGRISKVVR